MWGEIGENRRPVNAGSASNSAAPDEFIEQVVEKQASGRQARRLWAGGLEAGTLGG
jgi:hypothetical protein